MRKWLIAIRKEAGMMQFDVAQKCNCSQSMISKAELGGQISVEYAKRIASVLGFDWKRFFED